MADFDAGRTDLSGAASGVAIVTRGREELTSFQEKQIRSDAFKEWFGEWENSPRDASVVMTEWRPCVVYHGTRVPYAFDIFGLDRRTYRKRVGAPFVEAKDPTAYLGYHFAFTPDVAAHMTRKKGRPGRGHVFPIFLNIRCPVCAAESELKRWALRQEIRPMPPAVRETGKRTSARYSAKYASNARFRAKLNWQAGEFREGDRPDLCRKMGRSLRHELQEKGHDGIVYDNEIEGGVSFAVFEPSQIKSAIANDGTFDADDPSILS